MGKEPGALLTESTKEAPIPTAPSAVPVGLPSDLLRRRPDVRRRNLAEAMNANRRAVELSNELFIRGLVDFLNVLVAERFLYQSEDDLAQSEQMVSLNFIALYKALGGGWEIEQS